ncbi:hypothetical protein SLS60_008422 [Paraconiothyrium brasiliense]|uniref:Heterokaryon incompatibility domain-containing protein n=1 Tax=Paraconiothyrium brasiliense TaxID=300254 RepID=A0ABR3R0J1_9PLEO
MEKFLLKTGDQRGYDKIDKACEAVCDFAHEHNRNLEWIWIDSCCIDKSNDDERSEAINSMYQWYARSYVCIVYLEDVDTWVEASFSEWFKRGWTLQELIAPERVLFYNKHWHGCGSRNDYSPGLSDQTQYPFKDRSDHIADITKIDVSLLRLSNRRAIKRRLDSIPACQKMAWSSDRKTTKDEDMAYCLIGIFDIPHMYLKRGEGRRAFIRLQEEIVKRNNDLTLFAWKLQRDAGDACLDDNRLGNEELSQGATSQLPFTDSDATSDLHGVFACGPCHFRHASRIEPTQLAVYNDEITVTSRGVKLCTPLLGSEPFLPFNMPLYCMEQGSSELLSIELRLLGGSIYARTNCTQLPELHKDAKVIPNQDEVFLAHNIHHFQDCAGEMHKHAIRLPASILGELQLVKVSPGYLCSSKHNLVITNGRRFFVGCANYESIATRTMVTLLFGLDYLQKPWFCFSNADKSFEPHSLESRKLYLERVWRPASQHAKTAYLGERRNFIFLNIITDGRAFLQGNMRAIRQQYCDQEVFSVEFRTAPLYGKFPETTNPLTLDQTGSDTNAVPSVELPPEDMNQQSEIILKSRGPGHSYGPSHPVGTSMMGGRAISGGPKRPPGPSAPPASKRLSGIHLRSIGTTPSMRSDTIRLEDILYVQSAVQTHPSASNVASEQSTAGSWQDSHRTVTPPLPHFQQQRALLEAQDQRRLYLRGKGQGGNHALQDYQMQRMLLEQQNKKRLLMAREEQNNIQIEGLRQGQHQPQQPDTGDLESIAEVREESPSGSITGRASKHDLQDQPMRDEGSSQEEATETQEITTFLSTTPTYDPPSALQKSLRAYVGQSQEVISSQRIGSPDDCDA